MYLVIGYKPSYDVYSRNCLMESYSSYSVVEKFDTALAVAQYIARVDANNTKGADWCWTVVTSNMISDEDYYFGSCLESNSDMPSDVASILEAERTKARAIVADKQRKQQIEEERKRIEEQRLEDEATFERLKVKLNKKEV